MVVVITVVFVVVGGGGGCGYTGLGDDWVCVAVDVGAPMLLVDDSGGGGGGGCSDGCGGVWV